MGNPRSVASFCSAVTITVAAALVAIPVSTAADRAGGASRLSVSPSFVPYGTHGIATGRLPGQKRRACVQWKHQTYVGWNTVGCGQTKPNGTFRIKFIDWPDYDLVGTKIRVLAQPVKKRKLTRAVTPIVVITLGGEFGPKSPPPPPPTTPPVTAPGNPAYEDQVVTLVNAERAEAGCEPVVSDESLRTSARNHSADMAVNGYFAHTSQDGRQPGDRMEAAGYQWASYGENIAYGAVTPEDVMAMWMASAGHRSNIENCAFEDLGVGLAYSTDSVPYWTQNFGSR